ncbi:MAG: hypothetical protein ACON34_00750 [Flavobacteriales bacterium]
MRTIGFMAMALIILITPLAHLGFYKGSLSCAISGDFCDKSALAALVQSLCSELGEPDSPMQRTLLSSLVLAVVVATGLSSCSMEAGVYYLTKGIWNRNLTTLTSVDCFLDCGLTSHVNGREE